MPEKFYVINDDYRPADFIDKPQHTRRYQASSQRNNHGQRYKPQAWGGDNAE